MCRFLIRNDNPDKGTETVVRVEPILPAIGLEMITPIRGRKPKKGGIQWLTIAIRNDNPDKGTETYNKLETLHSNMD